MKLRKMTSAGMMDCKKALEEAEGDFQKAADIIREKGKLVAAKRADRETSEGAVKARIQGGRGILVCLGCETDFVSRNSDFQGLADAIADVAIAKFPADTQALLACELPDGTTVEKAIEIQTGKSGEKTIIAYYAPVEAPFVAQYIHTLTGKLGALVGFNKEVPAELAKGIVMQVASMSPVAISEADCPKEVVENELKVAVEKTKEEQIQKAVESEDHIESNTAKGWITPEQAAQAREIIKTVGAEKAANLNEQMIQNIAKGRLAKFFKENTLEAQEYQMGDGKISVKDAIAAVDKEAKVVVFKKFNLND